MSEKYRVGIIGCGSIANLHADSFRNVDEIDVVAISDPVDEARNEFGERHNIANRYHDAREMLDKEDLGIVIVTTWPKLHAPMTAAACARKPYAVICEKPMAASLGECDEMLTVASRYNVKLAIGHQRRFISTWTAARGLIASGTIGEPRQIVCRGGQGLLNDCSHLIDMMRYVLSDPNATWVIGNVERKTERYERDIPIEDRSAGIIGFDNGCVGLLLQEIAGPNEYGGLIYGSEGMIDLTESRVRVLNSRSAEWEERQADGRNPWEAQIRELISWIEEGTEHRGNAKHGRAAIEIIMAIYESARMHEVVQMPVRTLCSPLELMIESGELPVERPGRYDIRAFLLRGEER